ncbi:PEP-CTERM sorting domain-containing protein [Marinobacter sp. UBA2688]|uniref:PEP-CTERM sorting domain-containing protein n=1 Tax=Marinobacter sp. UBA2688 TaxID=1946816 RepID=UPI00257C8FC3|nr:PEP-CTERM sorting domain-containing protein [Marinobacter sp. UBA2688]|tara:strand:- start:25323 stop:25871 length:549 start_codon:yes stop_codon:yes gene_type:complete
MTYLQKFLLLLLLSASASSHASLLRYDMTFRASNPENSIDGEGYFVADTELNALVRARFTSTYFDVLFTGTNPLTSNEYYYFGHVVEAHDIADPASGIVFSPLFLIRAPEGDREFASNLHNHENGEFWGSLIVPLASLPPGSQRSYLDLDFQIGQPYSVMEPATLPLLFLGLAAIGIRRRFR